MLQKQVVPIGFDGSLDTKTDEKLVLPGRLTVLENGLRKKGRAIIKRNGYDALGKAINGTANEITGGQALAVFSDELLAFASNRVYSYSEASDSWIDKGPAYSVEVGSKQIVRNSAQQSVPDLAINQGIAVYAWADSRGGVRASVVEDSTGAQFQSDVVLNASGNLPRCVSVSGFIFVLYVHGTALKARRLNPLAPSSFESEITLESDVNAAGPYFDAVTHGSKLVFAYRSSTSIKVGYLTEDGTVGSTTIGLPNVTQILEDPENCLSAAVEPTTLDVWLFYHNGTDGLRYTVLRDDFSTKVAPTTIDATTSPIVLRVTAAPKSTSELRVFYEVNATNAYDHLIKTCTVTDARTVGSASVLKRSVGIASKAFSVGGAIYLNAVHETTLQSTFFTLDEDGAIVAKLLPGQAGGLPANHVLPSVVAISDSRVAFPAQIKTKFVSEANTTFTLKGVSCASIEFDPENAFAMGELGKNLHIAGGYLSVYDGVSVVEHGFHFFPENVAATPATSGGSMADGTYLYHAVWEWIDNHGQAHRSAPSIGVPAVVSGGSGSGKVTIAAPTLRLTSKTGSRTNAVLSVYRTKAAGVVAYKVTSISSPTYNDPAADSVSFVDTLNDSAIGANEILYTTGGVVENIAAPPCSVIDVYENRAIVDDSEDGLSIGFSKTCVPGEAVAFNDSFRLRSEPLGGRLSAVKMMDDKILLFKKSLIYFVSGDGPLDTGLQNNYSSPELVMSDVGCSDPNSVVLMPKGVMFKSAKGIYLIDRGLQVSYIGADVEAFNGQRITSAELIEDTNQVRFLTDAGVSLVYDYFFGQWATFTNHEGKDAVIWRGVYCYLRNDGTVYKENAERFLDDNVEYRLRIGTAWIKMAGVQGYQRVWRAGILGNYKSQHVLQMSVGYDYDPTYSDVITFNAGQELDQNYYGEGAAYGAEKIYGGVSDNVYQFRAHLRRQKCEAIRFLFEDVTAGTPGESYSLSDLSLEIGIKKGLFKMRSGKSVG